LLDTHVRWEVMETRLFSFNQINKEITKVIHPYKNQFCAAAFFCSSVGNFAKASLSLSIGAAKRPASVSKGGLSGALGWGLDQKDVSKI